MSGRKWTPEEDEILESMLGEYGSAAIAERLRVPVSRVNNRITNLGLSRKVVGVYSANELAGILGIEGNWIRHSLIDTGILPAQVIAGRGRFGITQVTEADLIAFLRTHPHLVDRKQVDAAYQRFVPERWITLGEAFRRGAAQARRQYRVYAATQRRRLPIRRASYKARGERLRKSA